MNEEFKNELVALGVTEAAISILVDQELTTPTDLVGLTYERYVALGIKAGSAKKLTDRYGPKVEPVIPAAPQGRTDSVEEIPEGKSPTKDQVTSYANQFGINPDMLSMLVFANVGAGAGLEMDLSAFLPIPQIVGGYNPKLRNMPFMIMGQIERRLGTPIVVINADGSVNTALTTQYIMSLEEGFEPAPDNVYYDESGAPYEVIGVGVDAQSIYDADPINPSKALQKSGMGTGRIKWNGVSLEVRQVVYYAAHPRKDSRIPELTETDETKLSWLREHIKPGVGRLALQSEFPNALTDYNEGLRSGSLPTLRVQLTRAPRKASTMPPRRRTTPRDLRESSEEGEPTEGEGFRRKRDTF